jgi:hypothetical protein
VVAGCCRGTPAPWGARHPAALYEIAGLVGLHLLLGRAPLRLAMPGFLVAFGALRLAISPLRERPALAVSLEPMFLALLVSALGALAAARESWRTHR